ncbi:MAG: hypothetical protein QOJ54_563, partial [Aliidongia sp.]|nr:hypothetical protein [Aliidongia sp.]
MVVQRSMRDRARAYFHAGPADRAEADLIAAAAEHGEVLTVGRRAQIVAEAGRLGRSPAYHFEWLRCAHHIVNGRAADFERRQAERRGLAPR